jgi:ketosteroid isomerase-like protein
MDGKIAELYAAVAAAQAQFAEGRAGAFQALWSPAEDVTIFGAFGGCESGWSAIQPRLAWAASQFRDGRWEYEPIAAMFGSEIGYTVGLERTAALIGGDTSPTTQELRVTHVFRREADQWRIVHRHADPLMATKAPFPRDG